jgi:phosphopantothenoylcysteine decarboxylase/phosphopantothenate--cysteine ligase
VLTGKHIVLGITGGIAAYKCAWLVRDLVKAGAEVQVVMTHSATQFITPLTLSTLSRREVLIDLFPASPDKPTDQWTKHIDLSLWADVMLIAPASANTLAKLAHGIADNFLTTLVVAARCPILLSPAMDVDMYENTTTQANIGALREAGFFVIDPESGELASGLTGAGRLPELVRLTDAIGKVLEGAHRDLKGKKVLVTAGPTQEPIDPVRYIGNRSSGKMGFALANAAALRGADVTLISGPVHLKTPRNTRRIDVETATEMLDAVKQEFPKCDVLVMAAAVADYSPAHAASRKIKRDEKGSGISIELKNNPDILKTLAPLKRHQSVVGFALETENGVENARRKLEAKSLDAIVLNNAGEEGAGFETDTNIVTIITAAGEVRKLPMMSKFDVANEILTQIARLR